MPKQKNKNFFKNNINGKQFHRGAICIMLNSVNKQICTHGSQNAERKKVDVKNTKQSFLVQKKSFLDHLIWENLYLDPQIIATFTTTIK